MYDKKTAATTQTAQWLQINFSFLLLFAITKRISHVTWRGRECVIKNCACKCNLCISMFSVLGERLCICDAVTRATLT